jgi:acyl-CoA thioester hydrolase
LRKSPDWGAGGWDAAVPESANVLTGLSGELTPTGHRLLARVYFADTDFSGVVYHARYLEFFERGR